MKSKIITFCIAFAMLIAQVPFALGQEPIASSEWGVVQALPPGDELVVEMKDGTTSKGMLNDVTATQLTLSKGNKTNNISQSDVRKLYRVKRGITRKKAALIGTAAVGGAGLIYGGVLYGKYPRDFDWSVVPAWGIIGAGIGAGIGALLGGRSKRTLIYEAR